MALAKAAGAAPAAAAAVAAPAAAAGVAGAGLDPRAQALALIGGLGDDSAGRLAQLSVERQRLAAVRRRVTQDMKREAKKRKVVMDKAATLSDADLLQVLANRAVNKAKAQAQAKAKAKAKAKG